ncbi:Putative protein of unknown function [Podospora comata]|uniref:Apple domain-containing protein n=1 Tax=Podospora comata TaxID=48703 RepID=A0ABY6SID4_PODCO|nr:Putative protein of unknown function [Podospora comata]
MANYQHQYGQPATEYSVLPEVADNSTSAPEVVTQNHTRVGGGGGTAAYSPPAYEQGFKPYSETATAVTAVQPSVPEFSETASPGPNKKVTILSVLVGILAVAVIALAATTGLMAKKANDKDAQIASMTAELQTVQSSSDGSNSSNEVAASEKETVTVTVAAPSATGTGSSDGSSSTSAFLIEDVSNGCNDRPESFTGKDYTTSLYGNVVFRRYCNQKTTSVPIYAMHTPDFETCLEACASWSQALPYAFSDVSDMNRVNVTCSAVNFVPKWTDKKESARKQSRGNCYFKSGEQTEEKSLRSSIGDTTVSHAAIVIKQAAKKD